MAFLKKLYLSTMFSRAIVFMMPQRIGLGVPELEFQQRFSKIQKITTHLILGTLLGTLIRIAIE